MDFDRDDGKGNGLTVRSVTPAGLPERGDAKPGSGAGSVSRAISGGAR